MFPRAAIALLVGVPLLCGGLGARASAGEIPHNPEQPKRGIESGVWALESWGNSGSADKLHKGARKVLKLIYIKGKKPKTAFKHLTGFSAAPDGKLRLHVYLPRAQKIQAAVALSTTAAYLWHESKPVALSKGWNKIEVPLGKPHWKTQKTGWAFQAGVEHLDDVRAVDLILLNGPQSGWVLVEGLRVDPDAAGRKIAKLIGEMTGTDFEKQAQAESELVRIGRPALEALYQASQSDRPQVMMRASLALRKIESQQETLPKDPELREQILAQREAQFFGEAKRRAEYQLQALKSEREKILSLSKGARAELARGREEFKTLKRTSEKDRKAYLETLSEMDRLSLELLRVFEKEQAQEAGKKDGAPRRKSEAAKTPQAASKKKIEGKGAPRPEKKAAPAGARRTEGSAKED